MTTPALSIRGVRRTFGSKVAVDDVDLTIDAGTFTGLLGPNGAGKSTLIACTVGLDRPDAGTAEVFGRDVWDEPDEARRLMGVLPDNLALPEYLSGRELLGHWGRLHGLDAAEVDSRADSLLRVLELDGSAERTLVLDYSTGMRKKIGIAVALIHRPRLLVLDEPFEAVDPLSAIAIRRILQSFVASGGSVVMSSHSMLLVESLCDVVSILVSGRLVLDEPMAQIRRRGTLEEVFIEAAGQPQDHTHDELSWLA
ncbi:ABC transporter ATP-binding protein [Ornithinimicrobium faecis]|uniref:ABC transporter ATP-binding protein n=1 Tax=Ornithinimicrobium faecis TaxID=2934158 RepID=UPI002118A7FA|nr:ABC transporter ATP-binding protein [Ornithinimicrobium sp. HY1745]